MHICGGLPRPSSSGTFFCIHLNFWKWGLMWSLLLSTRMFELYIWEGLYLRTDTKKNTCYDEIGLCAQIYRHHTTFKSGHNWEDLSLCDASKRVNFFSLTSSKVCISTRILKREMTSFLIHNSQPKDTVCDWIHRPKLSVDLEVPAVRFFFFRIT
jgi:hypothetical protein